LPNLRVQIIYLLSIAQKEIGISRG